MKAPDYQGGGLVNLIGELETRLTGSAAAPPLRPDLAAVVPDASTYVLVVFDGLGALQLDHPAAASLAGAERGRLDAPFPTTTTVSLATIATGLPPSTHGLLAYQLWLPDREAVVNTIHWTTLWGDPVDVDTTRFLPAPNLWERLGEAGKEPITIQPGHLAGTPLSRALYRGCRFEPVFTLDELIEATIQLAAVPGRLIVVYVPHVDFAAHVSGLGSPEYATALATANTIWEGITHRLPAGATALGTADHGMVDVPKHHQIRLAKPLEKGRTLYGDSRAMFVRNGGADLAGDVPATWLGLGEVASWWGPGPLHPAFSDRSPDGVLLADHGKAVLHSHSDDRMVGHHGGLTNEERLIPLLVFPTPHPHPV